MPSISTAGLGGSGLDVSGLVEKLVAAEGDPVTSRLNRKEAGFQLGLSAIGTFKSALADFKSSLSSLDDPQSFNAISANSSDADSLEISATNSAVPGRYEINVQQLAQAQKLNSKAFESDIEPIGSGILVIDFGMHNQTTNSFDVNTNQPLKRIEIDSENNSLRDIQQVINNANAGVRASVVNDGVGYRLVISAENTGLDNSMRIIVQDADGNDTDGAGLSAFSFDPTAINSQGKQLEQSFAARNALVDIDGITVTSNSNTIKEPVPGITLTAKRINEDTAVVLDVKKDEQKIKSAVQNFVAGYNELVTTVSALTGYDPETGEAGPLAGDASVRGVSSQLRRALGTSFNGINEHLTSLSSIGIDTSREGVLTLDEYKLDRAIASHSNEIKHLFSSAVSATDRNISVISSEKIPTINGIFDIKLSQTASKGMYRGLIASGFPFTINDASDNLVVMVDGLTSGRLSLAKRVYNNADELARELERVINSDRNMIDSGTSVEVKHADNKFELTSNNPGGNSIVSVISADANLAALAGLVARPGVAGQAMQATVSNADSVIDGSKLKFKGQLEGISLDIKGSKTGDRGSLIVTNGIAAILDDLVNNFLSGNGILETRIDGFNTRIKDIVKQREDLVRKLEVSEQRYLKQFTNLDATIGKMRSTSNFLGNQLAQVAAAGPKPPQK